MKNIFNKFLTVLGNIKRSLSKPDPHDWAGVLMKKRDWR